MIFNLGETNSIANDFLNSLRDPVLQQDRARFRKNIERLGEIMAYEISKKLVFEAHTLRTVLGEAKTHLLATQPVLVTVLRAGLPYFNGFQHFFDKSDCGFIGAYRKEEEELTVQLDYLAAPSLNDRTLILIDPMLATGKSFVRSIEALHKHGIPSHIHIASLIAAPEGIDYLQKNIKTAYTLWTFSIDKALNHQSYIVPGLGDAGDLCFGDKL
jgi:uracil phosphoribosyltransferase